MGDVTHILQAIDQGDGQASEQLLPLVYEELRRLAASKLHHESPAQTLSATALVHEAYLRLLGGQHPQAWNGQGHFFGAAAEAMRRIMIESARRKHRVKHGGHLYRIDLDGAAVIDPRESDDILALDEALTEFAEEEPAAYGVVRLRYFAGLTIEQTAEVLSISVRTANRHWAFAKAWLFDRMTRDRSTK